MQPVREITDRYLPEGTLSSDSRLTVYNAVDSQQGGRVAVELVEASRGSTSGAAGRFLEAVATLGRLRNAGLPAVIDGGVTDDGELFLVREPVEGRTFETLGGESPGQIVSLLLQVISALEALARQDIFHGALSPQTLWVVPGPERVRAVITGLGYAAWVSRQPDVDPDRGRREDIRDLAAVATRLFGATVTDPSTPAPGVQLPLAIAFELEEAEALRALLERCLQQDPADRPDSYSEVRTQLCEALWGETQVKAGVEDSGAPPARLTFTTVPEYTVVQSIEETDASEPADEGEITKVVLPDELESWPEDGEGTGSDTAVGAEPAAEAQASDLPQPEEILTPVSFVPTGEGTGSGAAAEPPEPIPTPPPPPPATGAAAPPPAGPGATAATAARPWRAARSPMPAAAAAGRPPVGTRRRWLAPLALGAGALGLLIAVGLAALFLLSRRGDSAPEATQGAAPAVPAAAATGGAAQQAPAAIPGVLDAQIQAALIAFLDGEDGAEARRLLAEISPERRAGFSPLECAALSALEESLALTSDEEVLDRLTRGFAATDLSLLRVALQRIAGREEAFVRRYPERADEVRRARRAVALFDRARAAVRGDRPQEVLQVTGVLMDEFPGWEGVLSLRETAAVSIENQADLLFEQGRYEQALNRLTVLSLEWPDREGLDRRDELIRTRQVAERDVGELLSAAERAGEEGRPDDGLALLSGVHATRRLAPRLAEIRRGLEEQLAGLDREAPRIAPLDDSTPEFGRDETARIAFRVADDFRVDRVSVHGRGEGGAWELLPYRRRSGDARDGEYEVTIDPDFHRNSRVEYYVTATDVSGQAASLGAEEQPLEIRRKRWFRRLLPR